MKAFAIGYSKEELPKEVGFEFFTEKLHKEDYNRVMNSMRKLLIGKSNIYEVEYRIRSKNGRWKWFYDRGAITKRDQDGKPILIAGIVFDITERKTMEKNIKQKNKKLIQLATRDGLTNVFNHKTILNRLNEEMERAERAKQNLCVIMMDIDNFKKVNDVYGHQAGDKVLKNIAKVIRQNCRKVDILGRYGGEEFLLILPNTNSANACDLGERIRKGIENSIVAENIKVTISCGVAQFTQGKATSLIGQADKKLYIAKASGKNRVEC